LGPLNAEVPVKVSETLGEETRLVNKLGEHMGRNPWVFISRDEVTGRLAVYSSLTQDGIRAFLKRYTKLKNVRGHDELPMEGQHRV